MMARPIVHDTDFRMRVDQATSKMFDAHEEAGDSTLLIIHPESTPIIHWFLNHSYIRAHLIKYYYLTYNDRRHNTLHPASDGSNSFSTRRQQIIAGSKYNPIITLDCTCSIHDAPRCPKIVQWIWRQYIRWSDFRTCFSERQGGSDAEFLLFQLVETFLAGSPYAMFARRHQEYLNVLENIGEIFVWFEEEIEKNWEDSVVPDVLHIRDDCFRAA